MDEIHAHKTTTSSEHSEEEHKERKGARKGVYFIQYVDVAVLELLG